MNSSRRLRFPAADQFRCIDAAASFKKLPNGTGKFPAARTCGGVEADDGVRTRDPQLGKLMLYQLSYVRVRLNDSGIVAE